MPCRQVALQGLQPGRQAAALYGAERDGRQRRDHPGPFRCAKGLVGEHGHSLAAAGLALTVAQFGGFVGRLGFWLIIGPRLGVMALLTGIGFGMTAAAPEALSSAPGKSIPPG